MILLEWGTTEPYTQKNKFTGNKCYIFSLRTISIHPGLKCWVVNRSAPICTNPSLLDRSILTATLHLGLLQYSILNSLLNIVIKQRSVSQQALVHIFNKDFLRKAFKNIITFITDSHRMLADKKKNEGPGEKESPFHLTLPSPNTPPPPHKKKKNGRR